MEFVKLPGSASVYKVEGNTYTPLGTPQAYAEATGQNPNGPINWSAVKNVPATYLQGKSQQQTAQVTPGYAGPSSPYNGAAYGPGSAEQARIDALTGANNPASALPTFTPAPTIDLPSLYQGLYDKSGIKDQQSQYDTLTKQLEDRQKALNDASAKINDNPFYSEATRVGRLAKLNDIAQKDMQVILNQQKNVQDRIATQKADIETQLNLQTKQFDINSQTAIQEFNKFNSLLSSGALDNASGQDIANITRSTGISSSMIQSAIDANKKRNTQTSMIQFNDGTNQGFVVVDQDGNVINRQVVAQSAPKSTGSTKEPTVQQGLREMTPLIVNKLNSYGHISPQDWQQALAQWLAAGFSKKDFIDNFRQYADPNRGDFSTAYGFSKS